MSNYCHGCLIGPAVESPEFAEWKKKHVCQRNHGGSSNSMEVEAAKVVFGRSIANHNLRYSTMVSDGDCKTNSVLNNMKVYGEEHPVVKEDCVNHVAKRMFTSIEVLKAKEKHSDYPLTGRGKLTAAIQKKLCGYYGSNLKLNAPNVQAMKNGVYASLMHIVSTDEDPRHLFCPPGERSWCFFQRAKATNQVPRPHKPDMNRRVAEKLLPLYERLTNPDLLQRCSRMMTQNSNECFNGQIWRRVPKTEPASLNTVNSGTAMATLEYNLGPVGFNRVLNDLGVSPGHHQDVRVRRATVKRLKRASASMSRASLLKRKERKRNAASQQDFYEAREGVVYESGAF